MGLLAAAPAVGRSVGAFFSGRLGRAGHQGRAVMWSIGFLTRPPRGAGRRVSRWPGPGLVVRTWPLGQGVLPAPDGRVFVPIRPAPGTASQVAQSP